MFHIVDAALDADCSAGEVGNCEPNNHEVCDADSKCICDSTNGYVVAADSAICELAGKWVFICFYTCLFRYSGVFRIYPYKVSIFLHT